MATEASLYDYYRKMRRDFLKAKKEYNVTHNGSRYVVRDKKGRFVIITRHPFAA